MPRKPDVRKESLTVIIEGRPNTVTLHPPREPRKTWYAYWSGLTFSRSTGATNLQDAIAVAESMVRNGGKRSMPPDDLMSDEEFEQIQRIHFGRRTDDDSKSRAEKSLESCLDAILAFKQITGLNRVTAATQDDCARFQREALLICVGVI